MVRGRRVRAVVECTRNDDCCSPNPKRKGPINGKLSHHTPNNKTQTITQFFQSVECESKLNQELSDSNDLDDTEKEEFKDIITTPNQTAKIGKCKGYLNDILSPPTPHRIEFRCADYFEDTKVALKQEHDTDCDDDDDNDKKLEIQPIQASMVAPPLPKARRRLNNNQTSNQQGSLKKQANNKGNNHTLTEYFPVRRSVRKTNKIVLEEKQRNMEHILRKGMEVGLKVQTFEGKGRGIVAAQVFNRGDFVVEYAGDLIEITEAKSRETRYAQDQNTGCYMYYFKHKDQQYCIDATAESGRLGRLVNHSRNGNLITRTVDVDRKPRLILVAKDNIELGEEVTYDYGDRSKESLLHHPWLAY